MSPLASPRAGTYWKSSPTTVVTSPRASLWCTDFAEAAPGTATSRPPTMAAMAIQRARTGVTEDMYTQRSARGDGLPGARAVDDVPAGEVVPVAPADREPIGGRETQAGLLVSEGCVLGADRAVDQMRLGGGRPEDAAASAEVG